MNKRFCKLGQYAAKAVCLVAICGAYSCADDYKWDDENPSFLGPSIYEYLRTDGSYKNFVKLIDDLDYKEVLNRTGSRTLFVADDKAFDEFFSDNSWGVKSYDQLTNAQKRLLLNSAMIKNAYLMEMMSSMPAGGGDNDEPIKGQCLRRETAASVSDSVPHLFADDIPVTYNANDIDYWGRFRKSPTGIHVAMDATAPMITHFLNTQLANNEITDEDFKIIVGKERSKNDSYIFDCKVIQQDITCLNGYINKLDKVLVPPQNMAEVLRTNKNTQIFSHMLDRFSAPFYNETLTRSYQLIYGNDVDSVFQKRYFSLRSQGNANLFNDKGTDLGNNPNGNPVFDNKSNKPLPFDPGWNGYQTDDKTNKAKDMAVIFAPTDEKLMNYFFGEGGGGKFLVNAYAPELAAQITENEKDLNKVYQAIDQVPRNTIRALLNNLMKASFNSSVPSKFETIKNSAQDAMFDNNYDYHRDNIVDVLLANNGIIYLMNEVVTPAEYAAVSAPAYVEKDKRIFNWAIQSDKLGDIPTNYYAYLLAMSSRFSFIVPQDNNFWYIDPLSFYAPEIDGTTLKARAFLYEWDEKNSKPKVASYEYIYDALTQTGTIGQALTNENLTEKCYGNRLKDMLETHTIIHEDNTETTGIDETETGVECNQHYFNSKNGSVIYTENAPKQKAGMTVKGGWQLNNDDVCSVIGFDDKSRKNTGYGNGFAYMIDKPMIPTIESVYSALYKNPNFSKFFELCQTDEEVLTEIGIKSAADKNRFNIFVNNGGLPCYYFKKDGAGNFTTEFAKTEAGNATNVRFFNNYRYTIYVPTNAAVEAAIKAGLPTWQQLRDYLELDKEDDEKTELTPDEEKARNTKAQAMATAIINFVKYHFQDNAIYADVSPLKSSDYETATVNSEKGVYIKLNVSSTGNGAVTLKDQAGHTRHLTADKNIVVRDYITNGTKGTESAMNLTLTSSSSAVLHGIDGVLDYKSYPNGRYDSDWTTEAKARAYLAKFRLEE